MPDSDAWPAPLLAWVQHNPALETPLRDALAASWEAGRRAGIDDAYASRNQNPWVLHCSWPSSTQCTEPRARGYLCTEHYEIAVNLIAEPE